MCIHPSPHTASDCAGIEEGEVGGGVVGGAWL